MNWIDLVSLNILTSKDQLLEWIGSLTFYSILLVLAINNAYVLGFFVSRIRGWEGEN